MEGGNCLYKERINSGLGIFELRVDSTGELVSAKSEVSLITIYSTSYKIIIKRTTAPTNWLPVGMNVDRAEAWLVYVIKRLGRKEEVTISFELLPTFAATQVEADTGQWLTAVEFEDGNRQVHIGTQDEEYFAWYGEREWMPERLEKSLVRNELAVTVIKENGLKSKVPELLPQEQFYLHYILAESPRRKSVDYPDDWDVSTWYAVDQARQALEAAWDKQTNQIDL